MWPVSAAYLQALRGPHSVVSRVDAYRGGVRLAADLPVVDGTVTVDAGSQVGRTLDVTIGGAGWAPRTFDDVLAPFGTFLHVWSGVRFPSGSVEWVPLGRFRVETPADAEGDPQVSVHGVDPSAVIADARFLSPRAGATGARIVDQIAGLVQEVHTCTTSLFGYSNLVGKVVWDSDRWGAVQDMASALGAEVFFSPDGTLVVRPEPTLLGAFVWTVDAGVSGVMVSAEKQMSREGVYNAVVARGEQAADVAPVQAVVYDLDPASPTYWLGPFGQKPRFYASPMITTTAQATSAAGAIFARLKGVSRTLDLGSVPNPALERGDVIDVAFPDRRHEKHLVETLTIPLTAGQMKVGTRSSDPQAP